VPQGREDTVVHSVERLFDALRNCIAGVVAVTEAYILAAIDLAANRAPAARAVDYPIAVQVFPQVAVAVHVGPVEDVQTPAGVVVDVVVAFRLKLLERIGQADVDDVGARGNHAGQFHQVVRPVEVALFQRAVLAGDVDRLLARADEPLIIDLQGDVGCTRVEDRERLGRGLAGVHDLGEGLVLGAAEVAEGPAIGRRVCTGQARRDLDRFERVDRACALGEPVVVGLVSAGHQDGAGLDVGGPAAVLGLEGLVDERDIARGSRGGLARAAPDFPGVPAVQRLAQRERARAPGAFGQHAHAVVAHGRRAAVRPAHQVIVDQLVDSCNAVEAAR